MCPQVDYLGCLPQLFRFERSVYMKVEYYISSLILAREDGERERQRDYFFIKLNHFLRLPGGIQFLASYSRTCCRDWGQEYHSECKVRTDSRKMYI